MFGCMSVIGCGTFEELVLPLWLSALRRPFSVFRLGNGEHTTVVVAERQIQTMNRAIVIVGHGSHRSQALSAAVWRQVDWLRETGAADEVTAAFWKEQPAFHTVLSSLTATDIAVIPYFASDGFFTRQVIPAEMGIQLGVNPIDGRTIRYSEPVGTHPRTVAMVTSRIREALLDNAISVNACALAIIGHGTRRSPAGVNAANSIASQIAADVGFPEHTAVFLDVAPYIQDVFSLTSQPFILCVPYFVASGMHAADDVPERLGLAPGVFSGSCRGRTVTLMGVIDDSTDVGAVIQELVVESGQPVSRACAGSSWDHFPAVGRMPLWNAVNHHGSLRFGQLLLSPDKVRPDSQGDAQQVDAIPALRRWVQGKPHRPLATRSDLPKGWWIGAGSAQRLHAIVETIYPGAVADWAAAQDDTFQPGSLKQCAGRQVGDYRSIATMVERDVTRMTEAVCSRCIRVPSWANGDVLPGTVPCYEPCSWWLARALSNRTTASTPTITTDSD